MDSEYDSKFEEMKKYIPFLESMIKRLESTSSTLNPRQAQLDKIRSLRDLLLDKKKRMKMENLLKCEQVLVNLYAKVEQRDSLTDKKDAGFSINSPTLKEKSDLEVVRNKLKTVAKIQDASQDTLPEIARASDIEEMTTSGPKEPALFQRRPNKSSLSPTRHSSSKNNEEGNNSQAANSKRNYTRVLVSPETSSRRWSPNGNSEEKLFSRRSPRRSPRRYSPTYHKKERKKSSKESNQSHLQKSQGINITLNVPEESLNSLNTKDILPRIINCSDGDVDIDTLRELRKQILGELKKTGANDDISDLILKSYDKKVNETQKKYEIEEGELSDSESEAIESIYGSLVVKEHNNSGQSKNMVDKDNRKIQICLVINSDKDQPDTAANKIAQPIKNVDTSDFEMYNNKDEIAKKVDKSELVPTIDDEGEKTANTSNTNVKTSNTDKKMVETEPKLTGSDALSNIEKSETRENNVKSQSDISSTTNVLYPNHLEKRAETPTKGLETESSRLSQSIIETQLKQPSQMVSEMDLENASKKAVETSSSCTVPFKANFYKPLVESENIETVEVAKPKENLDNTKINPQSESEHSITVVNSFKSNIENKLEQMDGSVEIPLLNEPTVAQKPAKSTVSEIDILQALKNEILSESIAIPVSEAATPPLHQPKVVKVVSAQEILPKKRISIEKYKEKSVQSTNLSFCKESNVCSKDDIMKKSSIKLTEKECERFNIPKISFDDEDSSEEEIDKDDYSVDDIYGDLAPKSPDHDESSNIESAPPIIIPADPVKTVTVNPNADVDMRSLQIVSPTPKMSSLFSKVLMTPSTAAAIEAKNDTKFEQNRISNDYRPPLIDPRVRNQQNSIEMSSPRSIISDRTSRPNFVTSTPSPAPNMTPIMTPNARSYEVTPSHQPFDVEQVNRKHVYAPSFSAIESHDLEKSGSREIRPWDHRESKHERRSRFEDSREPSRKWEDRDPRGNSLQRDINKGGGRNDRFEKREERPYSRADCPLTPLPSFGRSEPSIPLMNIPFGRGDCPTTPSHPFGRSDCPPTPNHPFGRADCSTTPSHTFGRSDCPVTPNHPFGRSDCPTTPSHPFGRSDHPSTPIHPFGRSDGPPPSLMYNSHSFGALECPPTPSNAFGRSECPKTPSHPFGRSECPTTPSHPFGRSDNVGTSHSFGRSDYNSKFTKDPRLNRKSDYESSSLYDEKERGYYKERGYNRGSSYKSQSKSYGGLDSYRNFDREQSTGKSDKYRYYPEKSGHQFNSDQSRNERDSSTSRDYDNDRYCKGKSSRYENDFSYKEVGSRRFQHEVSVGKSGRSDGNYLSSSRAPRIGTAQPKEPENRLSVKPDAGRSFTIDTSVNTTFQNLIESGKGIQVFDYSFDARRQRAASVGRTFTRESSVGRSLPRESSVGRTLTQDSQSRFHDNEHKKKIFRRASSVGRDLAVSKRERSFQEIKADFESYRFNIKTNMVNQMDVKNKNNTEHNDRSRKDIFEKREQRSLSSSNTGYSPRENPRDPRMRKVNYKDPRMRRLEKEGLGREQQRRSSGIDYSSDNIARGTVLGSGCGVKNYKIPKIKRPVEEKSLERVESETNDKKENEAKSNKEIEIGKGQEIGKDTKDKEKINEKERTKVKESEKVLEKPKETENIKMTKNEHNQSDDKKKINDESIKVKNLSKQDIIIESNDSITSKSDHNIERRVTRSSAKGLTETQVSPLSSPIKTRTRKYKKSILHDSDSDFEKDSRIEDILTTKTSQPCSPTKNKTTKKTSDVPLDSSFGMDDLEMFADNAATDPVIDNINALIADLDNDIDTSKTDNGNDFTKEMTLENMLESITCSVNNDSKLADDKVSDVETTNNNKKAVDNPVQEKVLVQNNKEPQSLNVATTIVESADASHKNNLNEKREYLKNNKFSEDLSSQVENSSTQSGSNDLNKNKINEQSEAGTNYAPAVNIVMNEDIVSTTHIESQPAEDNSKLTDIDNLSTPDSTNNNDEIIPDTVKEVGLADSTNEVHNETNVTSTKAVEEPRPSHKPDNQAFDSIGSLLSLLQDKSKIKEVLSMLGGQSGENEKIKKKLEKLSEIMSDEDEDLNDDTGKEHIDDEVVTSVHDNQGNKEHVKDKHDDTTSSNIDNLSLVPNIDESSVSNLDSDSFHSKENDQTKVVEENLCQLSEIEENINNTVSIEEQPKDSNEDASAENSHENNETEETYADAAREQVEETPKPKRKMTKRSKFAKKNKGKQSAKKVTSNVAKPVTRGAITNAVPAVPKVKKPSRELLKLQEDIKEMFIRDEVLSSTGIRMCRLAKLVDDKKENTSENEPVVVIEKFKDATEKKEDAPNQDKGKKKKSGPKSKVKLNDSSLVTDKDDTSLSSSPKYKPGPKSKTKQSKERDPYAFESDSIDTNTEKASDDDLDSDSGSASIASSRSFGSSECLADIKKKTKRKRRSWQAGVIKTKHKKKKTEAKVSEPIKNMEDEIPTEPIQIPDRNCFVDRTYCFRKGVATYNCRLCSYIGNDIVHHYKNQHPHIEIPLSRMAPMLAKKAIEQCTEINFKAVSKISSDNYICIFCHKEFPKRTKSVLETFFWHIVSTHTGEYKQTCTECVSDSQCPLKLDIPSPPKDIEGQLIGYICKKCNFTQISLENLKTHVIVRHNDQQTAVYTINLSIMSKKALKNLLHHSNTPEPRVLRSCRSNQSLTEPSDDCSDIIETASHISEAESIEQKEREEKILAEVKPSTIQSKIRFEADENISELLPSNSVDSDNVSIKTEKTEVDNIDDVVQNEESKATETNETSEITRPTDTPTEEPTQASNDIVDHPHFKINFTESGAKEYICCINRQDKHFKTTLLISMKKHVQIKHSENWDGYCYVCKVIVTPQGSQRFKDCLQHYLDKHMDDFPLLEKEMLATDSNEVASAIPDDQTIVKPVETEPVETATTKPYINVRPLSELISKDEETNFPKIATVMSLGTPTVEPPRPSPTYPTIRAEKPPPEKQFQYEEAQAEVMSKKHRVVLDTMMSRDKLVKVYKCAGRFCSFTTDSAEDALLHASTHQRIGGIDSLKCSYCDFESCENAIDLVMHVFRSHGNCQYSCARCFYRAAASQLVGAHAARAHPTAAGAPVLRTTAAVAPPAAADMLTREQAVHYYVCGHNDQNGICKFRTYIPEKFSEHLQLRHGSEASHPCHYCSGSAASPDELVQHLKSHGLKLYQCTWCVRGVDTESELLAHVSAAHPARQPQAYLRIITNKDGTNELRVLPLAFLNKSKIHTEDVVPSSTNENPVREAERSIELEKLIGHANLIIEAANQPADTTPPDAEPVIEDMLPPAVKDTPVIAPESEPIAVIPPTQASPPRPESLPNNSLQETPILKTEPLETPKELPSDIVVLDSDEEEPRQNVIDLSDDEPSTAAPNNPSGAQIHKPENRYKKIAPCLLHHCPKCSLICKSMKGFKKHLMSCLGQSKSLLTCPHCYLTMPSKVDLLAHYILDHREGVRHECGECGLNFASIQIAKRHMKPAHNVDDSIVTTTTQNGVVHYTVSARKQRIQPKRKLSSTSTEASVPKRRYLPQDVDKLPINPILDQLVYCSICEFSTKVRLNMVRHLQMHTEQQPVPQTAPVNPVPHLETNEKHFDKMVNLASSSILTRAPDKTSRTENEPTVTLLIPPEAASRYPKYVPERQRLTCGAKGCSYISVDEQMLRYHWETLHSGTNDYHCVHCPPYQHLDTSKPLTAARILAHLKMHDVTLYACSSCSYYHYKREAVDKHLAEIHKGGKLMVVREEASTQPAPGPSQPTAAPTMDLKPWQCGLCKFKSMLRSDVIEHCSKTHQSKMQYKCGYCPFRTSAIENIGRHQTNYHVGKAADVFYYYYREGSVPDEPDGTSCWLKQRQKMGLTESEIKTEAQVSPPPSPAPNSVTGISATVTPINTTTNPTTVPAVNLNIVKKEVADDPSPELDLEEFCKKFGRFSEPNGLHYTCPLCKVVAEDTKEGMQCHLYEELKYRKWGCGLCSYKAFHKNGLNEHMSTEHPRQYQEPLELPADVNVEKWVAALLAHQTGGIARNKANLARLKQAVARNPPGPATTKPAPPEPISTDKYTAPDLERAFGPFGTANNMEFCCPKCKDTFKDEVSMKDHLETELTKIRWCCSVCTSNFQTYHEAQFHVKSHAGEPARPVEAIRDPAMRAAWLTAAIQTQKQAIKSVSSTPVTPEKNPQENDNNSLLVVRYEENVSTPEDTQPVRRKRPAPDSDDERLTIDETFVAKKKGEKTCPYCDFTSRYNSAVRDHIPKHFNLKPYTCGYCNFGSYRQGVVNHIERMHPGLKTCVKYTEIPPELIANFVKKKSAEDDGPKLICLLCEKAVPEAETESHVHGNEKPDFAKKGDVVVKCCICLVLRIDVKSLQDHHNISHPDVPINYALFRLHHDTRDTHYCGHCNKGFKYLRDLKTHHNAVHGSFKLSYTTSPYIPQLSEEEKKRDDATPSVSHRRCARKSTTKLPTSNPVAKKSTTKLPTSNTEGYSFYKTKPLSLEEYANVTTLMPFCNTMMSFTLKKLSQIIKIQPKVLVKDIQSDIDSSDE